jgi:hypothetical protein
MMPHVPAATQHACAIVPVHEGSVHEGTANKDSMPRDDENAEHSKAQQTRDTQIAAALNSRLSSPASCCKLLCCDAQHAEPARCIQLLPGPPHSTKTSTSNDRQASMCYMCYMLQAASPRTFKPRFQTTHHWP